MFCTRCGSELRDIDRFCSQCGANVAAPHSAPATYPSRPLARIMYDKKIAGVCSGFARYDRSGAGDALRNPRTEALAPRTQEPKDGRPPQIRRSACAETRSGGTVSRATMSRRLRHGVSSGSCQQNDRSGRLVRTDPVVTSGCRTVG